MVKAKKGKKGDRDSDGDDASEMAGVESSKSRQKSEDVDEEEDIKSTKKQTKKPKKDKRKDDSDEENVEEEKATKKKATKKDKKKQQESDDDMDEKGSQKNEEIEKKSKKKGGKKDKKKVGDSDDEDASNRRKTSENQESDEEKSKSKKKGKKDKKKALVDSDDEIESLSKKVESVDISKAKKQKGKSKKKEDSEEEGGGSEEEVPSKTKPKAKGQPKPKGGFALLAMDDDDDDEEPEEPLSDRSESPEPIIEKPKPVVEKGGKKSKKGKKKKDEEEDIDKVLAELEIEYSGEKEAVPGKGDESGAVEKSKKAKKSDKESADVGEGDGEIEGADSVQKTATQKKKEKKKKQALKKEESVSGDAIELKETAEKTETTAKPSEEPGGEEDDKDEKKSKKKKKGKAEKEKEKEVKDLGKGPGRKTIVAMQEALKKIKEEEEKQKIEEEERIKREEEAEKARLEAIRVENEKREKKKQKEKERKERLKAEGKLLTAKQKADKARAQEMINALKAQGLELPDPGEKKARPGTRVKPTKAKAQTPPDGVNGVNEEKPAEPVPDPDQEVEKIEVEVVAAAAKEEEEEDVKDAWDAESSGEEEEPVSEKGGTAAAPAKKKVEQEAVDGPEDDSEEEDESDEEDDEDSSEESSESEDERKTDAEKKRDKAVQRIQKRKEDAEKNRSPDVLRAAVVCVLGHVDTGKTKILDKLRRTNVQDGEAGGITQQIGATNVPIDNIKETCKHVKGFADIELKIPGLLIIDTPGHESFSNLRSRGSSLCDIAILVVDIMHGIEPQTLESINLLKSKKTPFVVALNKIDRLYNWQTGGRKDIREILKAQAENTQLEFRQRTSEAVVQFAEQGLNAALFFENPDIRSYVSLVPTSAITGEGMGNLLGLMIELCQDMLAKRLMYSELLQCTVLEVKAIPGLGTTIDGILNGKLAEGDTIILAGTDGPIVTQIRSLLMPQPMKELRVKNAYVEYKEIKAAQGVKIAAKDLEKAIAGLNLQVACKADEVDIFCEEVAKELKHALSNIKLKDRGVYVQASTLGSLEALLEFLRTSKIPVSGIRIGPVVKKDVMKASIMLEHESQYATILAFDVKIERDAQELADSLGVKVFQADIIYHLFDKFMAYREELKQKKRDEFKNIAVFPCKLRILPQFIFNTRDPIVVGVIVEAGLVREGTPLCVPSKEFINVGVVTSVEVNHKPIDAARKGMEVSIKIENTTGEAPKLFGRHFDHTDLLISKISRQSIDACKDYFRDDLSKQDWQLMVELKKMFQIL